MGDRALRRESRENTRQTKALIAMLQNVRDASNEVMRERNKGMKISVLIHFQTRGSYTAKRVLRRVSLGL